MGKSVQDHLTGKLYLFLGKGNPQEDGNALYYVANVVTNSLERVETPQFRTLTDYGMVHNVTAGSVEATSQVTERIFAYLNYEANETPAGLHLIPTKEGYITFKGSSLSAVREGNALFLDICETITKDEYTELKKMERVLDTTIHLYPTLNSNVLTCVAVPAVVDTVTITEDAEKVIQPKESANADEPKQQNSYKEDVLINQHESMESPPTFDSPDSVFSTQPLQPWGKSMGNPKEATPEAKKEYLKKMFGRVWRSFEATSYAAFKIDREQGFVVANDKLKFVTRYFDEVVAEENPVLYKDLVDNYFKVPYVGNTSNLETNLVSVFGTIQGDCVEQLYAAFEYYLLTVIYDMWRGVDLDRATVRYINAAKEETKARLPERLVEQDINVKANPVFFRMYTRFGESAYNSRQGRGASQTHAPRKEKVSKRRTVINTPRKEPIRRIEFTILEQFFKEKGHVNLVEELQHKLDQFTNITSHEDIASYLLDTRKFSLHLGFIELHPPTSVVNGYSRHVQMMERHAEAVLQNRYLSNATFAIDVFKSEGLLEEGERLGASVKHGISGIEYNSALAYHLYGFGKGVELGTKNYSEQENMLTGTLFKQHGLTSEKSYRDVLSALAKVDDAPEAVKHLMVLLGAVHSTDVFVTKYPVGLVYLLERAIKAISQKQNAVLFRIAVLIGWIAVDINEKGNNSEANILATISEELVAFSGYSLAKASLGKSEDYLTRLNLNLPLRLKEEIIFFAKTGGLYTIYSAPLKQLASWGYSENFIENRVSLVPTEYTQYFNYYTPDATLKELAPITTFEKVTEKLLASESVTDTYRHNLFYMELLREMRENAVSEREDYPEFSPPKLFSPSSVVCAEEEEDASPFEKGSIKEVNNSIFVN